MPLIRPAFHSLIALTVVAVSGQTARTAEPIRARRARHRADPQLCVEAGRVDSGAIQDVSSSGDGQNRRDVLRVVRGGEGSRGWQRDRAIYTRSTRLGTSSLISRWVRAPCTTRAASITTARASGCRWPSIGPTAARSCTAWIPQTMKATEVLRFADHIGAIVHNTDDDTLHGVSWGSRRFYRWTLGRDGTVTQRHDAA